MPRFVLCLLLPLSLTACSTLLNNLPGVYTLEIQQGNMVDTDMVNQLKPGMTKRQVLFIMGSPMLVDFFHQKRWDYLYSKEIGGEDREQKRIALFFDGDLLTGVQGDFKPDLQAVRPVKEVTVDVPPRDLEKTLWEKVVWLFSDDEPVRKVKPVVETKKSVKAVPAKEGKKMAKPELNKQTTAPSVDVPPEKASDNNLLNNHF
jgi:outer membrane protein assembly factor BamE